MRVKPLLFCFILNISIHKTCHENYCDGIDCKLHGLCCVFLWHKKHNRRWRKRIISQMKNVRVFAVSLLQQLVASFIFNLVKKIVAAHANCTNKVFLASRCRPVRRMMCPNNQLVCWARISAVNWIAKIKLPRRSESPRIHIYTSLRGLKTQSSLNILK